MGIKPTSIAQNYTPLFPGIELNSVRRYLYRHQLNAQARIETALDGKRKS
jgi:hypothetical protein